MYIDDGTFLIDEGTKYAVTQFIHQKKGKSGENTVGWVNTKSYNTY